MFAKKCVMSILFLTDPKPIKILDKLQILYVIVKTPVSLILVEF